MARVTYTLESFKNYVESIRDSEDKDGCFQVPASIEGFFRDVVFPTTVYDTVWTELTIEKAISLAAGHPVHIGKVMARDHNIESPTITVSPAGIDTSLWELFYDSFETPTDINPSFRLLNPL